MSRLHIMILALALASTPALAADEWIGLDDTQPVLFGIDLGEDENGDSSKALLLSLPFGERMGFYGAYRKTELSDFDQEFDSLALMSAVWLQLSQLVDVEMQYFFEGDEGELEKETLGLALALNQGAWNFRLQLDAGETRFFTRDIDAALLDRFLPDSYSSDVSGVGVVLGWQGNSWYWQANYQKYDYAKDLGVLHRSAFARFVVRSSALAQSSLLIARNASLLLGYTDYDNDYSLQVSQDQSAIDQSYEDRLTLAWQHWASQHFGYSLTAATALPADASVGLTLGLRWML